MAHKHDMVIYKYRLGHLPEVASGITTSLPVGAEILYGNFDPNQPDMVCVWALVDKQQLLTESRVFQIFATGQEITGRFYLGTFFEIVDNPNMFQTIWHLWEIC